jgi:hypothetical protein
MTKCLLFKGDNVDAQIAEAFQDAIDECEENTLTEDEVDELADTIRGLIEDALGA